MEPVRCPSIGPDGEQCGRDDGHAGEHCSLIPNDARWEAARRYRQSQTETKRLVLKKRRKSSTSPTQRTMRLLRQQGSICAVVERFNQHAGPHGVRQDLFGFVDVLVLDPERGFVGIQCGSGSGHSAHRKKILENEIAPEWLRTGGRIEIWSWSLVKVKRGGTAVRWKPRVEELRLEDFE